MILTPLYLYVLIRFGIVSSASLKLSPSSSRFIRTSSLASRTMIFLKYNFSHGSCNTKYQYWYCPISHSGLPSFSSQILACSMLAGKPSTRKPLDSGCLPIASNSRSVTSSWNDGNERIFAVAKTLIARFVLCLAMHHQLKRQEISNTGRYDQVHIWLTQFHAKCEKVRRGEIDGACNQIVKTKLMR